MTPEEAILRLVTQRGPEKSICPTDAARALAGDQPGEAWRAHLRPVREAAMRLARAGSLVILRKGKPVENLDDIRGVIRLRLAPPKQEHG